MRLTVESLCTFGLRQLTFTHQVLLKRGTENDTENETEYGTESETKQTRENLMQ